MQDGPLGFCSVERPTSREAEEYAPLGEFRTCDISDAIHKSHTMTGIQAAYQPIKRIVGPAVTVSLPGSGFEMIGAAMHRGKPGDILVISTQGSNDAEHWGGDMSELALDLGFAGVVVDGAVRDAARMQQLGFPAFSRSIPTRVAVLGASWGEINMPVACGGVSVAPGDIVVADEHGVVAIPQEWLERAINHTRILVGSEERLQALAEIEARLLADGMLVLASDEL